MGDPMTAPQQQPGRKLTTPVIVAIAAATAFVLVCGGCVAGAVLTRIGNNTTSTASDNTAFVNTPAGDPTATGTIRIGTSTSPEPPLTVDAQADAPTTDELIVVPNGVGLDYQSAQDLWRAAGLHVAPAIDALGANRLPLIDSNWLVLSQDPEAGTVVPKGSFITATVKKYSDN